MLSEEKRAEISTPTLKQGLGCMQTVAAGVGRRGTNRISHSGRKRPQGLEGQIELIDDDHSIPSRVQ